MQELTEKEWGDISREMAHLIMQKINFKILDHEAVATMFNAIEGQVMTWIIEQLKKNQGFMAIDGPVANSKQEALNWFVDSYVYKKRLGIDYMHDRLKETVK